MVDKIYDQLIDLDDCVVNALNLFSENKPPKVDFDSFKKPIVIGSGNAAVTGKILFEGKDAVFADESSYLKKIKAKNDFDGAFLISASGGKHSPIIAKELKKKKIKSILFTNNPSAAAKDFVDEFHVFKKNTEPYTYNTSTYLGMILSKTKEDPKKILSNLKRLDSKIPKDLKKYNAFYLMIPEEFDSCKEMFLTKFHELFGPVINGRIFTFEQTKHAKTVIDYDKELFISIGVDNKVFGRHKINLPLGKDANYAEMISTGYYIIGKIQKQQKPYFKESIVRYCKESSKIFGEEIKPIVE